MARTWRCQSRVGLDFAADSSWRMPCKLWHLRSFEPISNGRSLPTGNSVRAEIRVNVWACGVCRTDFHVVDDELPDPRVQIIPGHEIVGRVDVLGSGVEGLRLGERVGAPLARPYVRYLSLLHRRPRKSRSSALYRPYTRRRFCDRYDRRRALYVPNR